MIWILLGYLVWLPAIIGWGSALPVLWGGTSHDGNMPHLSLTALSGLAVLGTTTNLLNFFTPVAAPIALAMLIAGWVLLALNRRYMLHIVAARPLTVLGYIFLGLVLLTYAAYFAHKGTGDYDMGLYHLQSVKWIIKNRLPLGLANLHGRFGFNSLWFSIEAMLQVPFGANQGPFILNGILFSLYGFTIVAALVEAISKRAKLSNTFLIATIPAWLDLTKRGYVGSMSPNFPIILLTFWLIALSIQSLESEQDWWQCEIVALWLAFFAITIKTLAVFLLLLPVSTLAWDLCKRRKLLPRSGLKKLPLAGCVAALLSVWVLRGVMLSGCIAYPISAGCFPLLPWAVPASAVEREAVWVQSWARQPRVPPEKVMANWDWLSPWWDQFKSTRIVQEAAILAGIGLALWALGTRQHNIRNLAPGGLPTLVVMVGTLIWFLTAPDLRFGEGYIRSLGVLFFSNGFYRLSTLWPSTRRISVLALVIVIGLMIYPRANLYFDMMTRQPVSFSYPSIPVVEVKENLTDEGVRVLSPIAGDQCWNAELPCTPYFDSRLHIVLDQAGRPQSFQASRGQDP
jgi:hypothetical protein